eukprot:g17414.t1
MTLLSAPWTQWPHKQGGESPMREAPFKRYQSEYWKRISESQGRQERHMLRTGGEFKVYQVSGRQKHEGPVFATRFLKAFELF